VSKSDRIRSLLKAGMSDEALSIAAKFYDASDDTKAYKRAVSAKNNPSFYKQIGKDPDEIYKNGLTLIQSRFT